MGHLRGVQGGSVCARKTGCAGGRHEHPAGRTGVRLVTEEHPQDAAVFAAAGPFTEEADPVAEAGSVAGVIDQILLDGQSQPKKQRHTAKRIWDRLKAEHAFGGGCTVVKDYVRQATLRHKEVFVPLAHPPGDAQADFGEALVVIAGEIPGVEEPGDARLSGHSLPEQEAGGGTGAV